MCREHSDHSERKTPTSDTFQEAWSHSAGVMDGMQPLRRQMFVFQNQMLYDVEMIGKLMRMNIFVSMFYISALLKASNGVDAPINDLQLFKDIKAALYSSSGFS